MHNFYFANVGFLSISMGEDEKGQTVRNGINE